MTAEGDMDDLLWGHLEGVRLVWVEAGEVAEPCRELLCHNHDMTSTLARFHGGEVVLEVLNEELGEGRYFREVLLKVAGETVEYGVIRIFLERFPDGVRREIEAGGKPLGAILNDSGLVYESRPVGFVRIASDGFRPDFFPAINGKFLFGRYNRLLGQDDEVLARILEILPTETT